MVECKGLKGRWGIFEMLFTNVVLRTLGFLDPNLLGVICKRVIT